MYSTVPSTFFTSHTTVQYVVSTCCALYTRCKQPRLYYCPPAITKHLSSAYNYTQFARLVIESLYYFSFRKIVNVFWTEIHIITYNITAVLLTQDTAESKNIDTRISRELRCKKSPCTVPIIPSYSCAFAVHEVGKNSND